MVSNFSLPEFEYWSNAEDVIRDCWGALGSWRKYLIAVDGRDGAGKTAFSRWLSFRCNMPVFNGDEFLLKKGGLKHRKELRRVICQRLEKDRPLIFDSILASDACGRFGLVPDYTIRVATVGVLGMEDFRERYDEYERRVTPDAVLILPCRSNSRPTGCTMAGDTHQSQCVNCPETRRLNASSFPWKCS